jgi:hypothetical protein
VINLDFMPSRQLALYAAKLFLTRSLAVLVALVLVLMTLDLLGSPARSSRLPGMEKRSFGATSGCVFRCSSRASCHFQFFSGL